MLAFGHTGITLGAAVLLTGVVNGNRFSKATEKEPIEPSRRFPRIVPTLRKSLSHKASWLTSLATRVDIRLLLVGSLFSDIIDKPVGQFFFRETFSNGRIFCHTLLFLVVVTIAGIYLYRHHRKTWLIAFSFGTLTHLVFDQMWHTPQTLFWPLLGLTFERADISNWIPNIFNALLTDPVVYLPELVGALTLIWFVLVLVHRRQFYAFIKKGQVL